MDHCAAPTCSRPVYATGLCEAHYRQRLRAPGCPLRPLRATGLVRIGSLRVSPGCALRVSEDRAGAREELERWARK